MSAEAIKQLSGGNDAICVTCIVLSFATVCGTTVHIRFFLEETGGVMMRFGFIAAVMYFPLVCYLTVHHLRQLAKDEGALVIALLLVAFFSVPVLLTDHHYSFGYSVAWMLLMAGAVIGEIGPLIAGLTLAGLVAGLWVAVPWVLEPYLHVIAAVL